MKNQFIPKPTELVRYKGKTAIFKSMNFGGKCVIKIDNGLCLKTIKDVDVSELKPLN